MQRQNQHSPYLDESLLQRVNLEPNDLNVTASTVIPCWSDCSGYDPSNDLDSLIFENECEYERQKERA